MRCLACGAEMILMKVVPDDTMAVSGFEHHTFMCSACDDIERRLVFSRPIEQNETDPVPVHTAPPIAPASTDQHEHATAPGISAPGISAPGISAPGILQRVLAKLRGR